MHLKHIRVVSTSLPREIGDGIILPEDFRFTDATPSPLTLQVTGLRHEGDGAITPGIDNEVVHPSAPRSSTPVITTGSSYSHISRPSASSTSNFVASADHAGGEERSGALINPLHGLGISAELYPMMLQNLLGLTSDMLDSMEFNPSMLQDMSLGGPGESMMGAFGSTSSSLAGNAGNTDPMVGPGPPNAPIALNMSVVPRVASTSSLSGALKRTREDGSPIVAKRSRFETLE
jgi:hypothetical protein